jgi:hypothetical protein
MFAGFQMLAFLGVIFLSLAALIFIGIFESKTLKNILIYSWGFIFLMIALSFIAKPFYTKMTLDKSDYYGNYVIDTTYFDPAQAKWQYDHFRFTIKRNDSIYFYVTEKNEVIKTYKGTITTLKPWSSEVLKINMEQPTHHILTYQPTIWRDIWSFTLVFRSPKFSNMYFVKD